MKRNAYGWVLSISILVALLVALASTLLCLCIVDISWSETIFYMNFMLAATIAGCVIHLFLFMRKSEIKPQIITFISLALVITFIMLLIIGSIEIFDSAYYGVHHDLALEICSGVNIGCCAVSAFGYFLYFLRAVFRWIHTAIQTAKQNRPKKKTPEEKAVDRINALRGYVESGKITQDEFDQMKERIIMSIK